MLWDIALSSLKCPSAIMALRCNGFLPRHDAALIPNFDLNSLLLSVNMDRNNGLTISGSGVSSS